MSLKSIRKLPDEPIIVIEQEGYVTSEDVIASDARSAPMMADVAGDLCLIIDTRASRTNFVETLKILKHYATNQPERESAFEVHVMLVGTDAMTKFAADSSRLDQFGRHNIPLFSTVEDALAAARQWLAARGAGREPTRAIDDLT